MKHDSHETLREAVENAGFHTIAEELEGWNRIVIASRREPTYLTGNSFWVTRARGTWYLGTWGGSLYRLSHSERIAELCIDWLTRCPRSTRSDFDHELKQAYDLWPISERDFGDLVRS